MIQQKTSFKQKLNDSLIKKIPNHQVIRIPKNNVIYHVGEKSDTVYFIESGQIKLLAPLPQSKDKEYVVAIHNPGDIFGELCILPLSEHLETAIAITNIYLKTIPSDQFLEHLNKELLLQDFIQYLIIRLTEQQHTIIANVKAAFIRLGEPNQ